MKIRKYWTACYLLLPSLPFTATRSYTFHDSLMYQNIVTWTYTAKNGKWEDSRETNFLCPQCCTKLHNLCSDITFMNRYRYCSYIQSTINTENIITKDFNLRIHVKHNVALKTGFLRTPQSISESTSLKTKSDANVE